MLRSEKQNSDRIYDVRDIDGTRLTVTGPHTLDGSTGFGLSVGDPRDIAGIYAGDRDDALALARQVLQHAGFKDVEISYEATDAA